jgi:hypothetical protein
LKNKFLGVYFHLETAQMVQHAPILPHAPDELTGQRLRRLGEGLGKVVYASEHWVVRRERSASEVLSLILIWKMIRRVEHLLPYGLGQRLLAKPSRQIRLLRVAVQPLVLAVPRSVWFMTHAGEMWRLYRSRDVRGETLARRYLGGTPLVPRRIEFPPVRVKVGGWPGWLNVTEATERVEATLHQRLADLARAGDFDEIERWLDRFLELRRAGWRHGLFSMDTHLKNFGVSGDRVVLLDAGGLTDRWTEIESRLSFEQVSTQPHIQLGLGAILGSRPDIARRFDVRWKTTVNIHHVRSHWPAIRA